ncbi:short-chain dehydrogenase/reductase family 16C member 6-like [Planococcus citri]|uniref:short-chain dehydrogenase/reductase family 16C member 6-like n=1 Tax=Planococcus citri TaxID=170843 RepID=UPI0031F84BA5
MANVNQNKSAAPNADEKEPNYSIPVPRVGVKEPLKLLIQTVYYFVIFVPLIVWDVISNFLTKPKSIRNSVVLITGSGRGLGRNLALKFAELNCNVACVDLDETNNADTVRLIKKKYPSVKAIAYKCNVALVDDIKNLSKNVSNDLGEVDIIINNAGLVSGANIVRSKLDTKYLDVMLDVNLKSHFLMIGVFLPKMIERNSGHIVAIASLAGLNGVPNGAAYSATKHGVVGFMESLYDELKTVPNNKIQTSCICPYFIATNEAYPETWDLRIPEISVNEATEAIIDAITRNKRIVAIPSHMYHISILTRLLPDRLRNIGQEIFYARINPPEKEITNNIDAVIEDSLNRKESNKKQTPSSDYSE